MILAELIGAFAEALAAFFMVIAELVASSAALLAELLFVLVTAGTSAAAERYRQRTSEQNTKADSAAAENGPKRFTYFHGALLALVLVTLSGSLTWRWVQHQRLVAVKTQVATLADGFADRARTKWDDALPAGRLTDKDSWGQPLELAVTREDLAVLIKVRSFGPDGKVSLDDVKAMRIVAAPPDKIAGGLAKRGWEAIRKRVLGERKHGEDEVEDEDKVQ